MTEPLEPLEPLVVGELASEAIEATIAGDQERVLDALQALLVGGTKRDAMSFVLSCIFTLIRGLPRRPKIMVVGGARILADGTIICDINLPPGQLLFAEMLRDYITGDGGGLLDRWLAADDENVSNAVQVAVSAAAGVVKSNRARLN